MLKQNREAAIAVIEKYPVNFEFPSPGAPYHFCFTFTDDFQKVVKWIPIDPPMCDFFQHLRFIEFLKNSVMDMFDHQRPNDV
jgi:hypothetical protein